MKFHTKLTLGQMRSVQLPPGVQWYRLTEQGSRSRVRKFDMVLSGGSAYGGQFGAQDYSAATWDEWGVVLGELFVLDPEARVPGTYEGWADFHHLTGDRYHPDDLPLSLCRRHKWTRYYVCSRQCQKCNAIHRWHASAIGDQNVTMPSAGTLTARISRPRAPRVLTPTVELYSSAIPAPNDDLGKYASNGAYAQRFRPTHAEDLLSRIDALIS